MNGAPAVKYGSPTTSFPRRADLDDDVRLSDKLAYATRREAAASGRRVFSTSSVVPGRVTALRSTRRDDVPVARGRAKRDARARGEREGQLGETGTLRSADRRT